MKAKRRATRRKTRRTVSNLATHKSVARRSTASTRRRRNPTKYLSRRRNPSVRGGGLIAKGLSLAAGAALVQFLLGFVPPIGGVSPLADAARTAAVGWGAGTVMNKTGVLRTYADDVMLAGFTLAGGKLISSFILPFATRVFQPARQSNGMSGIAAVTGIPPVMVPLPSPAPGANGNGVQGIAAIPGRFAR